VDIKVGCQVDLSARLGRENNINIDSSGKESASGGRSNAGSVGIKNSIKTSYSISITHLRSIGLKDCIKVSASLCGEGSASLCGEGSASLCVATCGGRGVAHTIKDCAF